MAGITVHYEVLNQLNTPTLYADTLALQPSPAIVGRIFFRTDSPFAIYRDTGTAWDLIANPDTTGITGTLAAGQVPYATGASTVAGTDNLFFDAANNRLGINTNSPGVPLDVHGTGTQMQLNGTGTNNSFLVFQNAGTSKWRIGNNYSAGTNYFSIFDSSNSVETLKIVSGATNTLTILASTTNQGNIKIQKTGSNPRLEIQQDTDGASNKAEAVFIGPSGSTGFGAIYKGTSTTTVLKIIAANDFGIYNYSSAGDIAIMNDFATGKIKFAGGGLSTSKMTLTAAGRLLINTTTEGTNVLEVNGTSNLNNTTTIYELYIGASDILLSRPTGSVFQITAAGTRISGNAIIGSTSAINVSAQLQADSTTKGFLPPRMTTTQKNAIGTPAAGLVVYDTTLGKLCVRTAAAWETITSV